jgi:hypothetical protein
MRNGTLAMGCDARGGGRWPLLVLAILGLGLVAGGCTSQSGGGGASQQETFAVQLADDVKSLDQGVFTYQVPASLSTGSTVTLNVAVTDIGRASNGADPFPVPSGWVMAPTDVPTGGIVGVAATCRGITCTALSAPRQPVLQDGDEGNWQWELSASAPGTGHVFLDATTYLANTDTVLHEAQPVEITISVTATPGYWVSTIGTWTKAVLGFIGFGTLVAVARFLWQRARREDKGASKAPGRQNAAKPAGGATGTRPRRRRSRPRRPREAGAPRPSRLTTAPIRP